MIPNKPAVLLASALAALLVAAAVVAQSTGTQVPDGQQVKIPATATSLAGSPGILSALGDQAAKDVPFNESEALTKLSALAQQRLDMTVASEAPSANAAPVKIAGRTIALGDLSIREFRRLENVTEVTSLNGTTNQLPGARTVWIATWERQDVFIEEWGTAGTIRAEFVMEDGTGRLLAASISKFNPNAAVNAGSN